MGKYRKCWETKPFLKDWIQEVPHDNTKAYCKVCKRELYAHRFSVLKHTATKKHQDNFEKLMDNQNSMDPNLKQKPQCMVLSQGNLSTLVDIQELQENGEELLIQEAMIEEDEQAYEETDDIFNRSTNKATKSSTLDLSYHSEFKTSFIPVNNGERELSNKFQHVKETMSQSSMETRTISSHILDTSLGKAAANVEVTIYRLQNKHWELLNQATTNEDGRASQLVSVNEFKTGIYKLHFNVRPYFAANDIASFYPFIEIVVECKEGQHYHIPLLLNPFGYSTYRGT